MFSKIKDIRVKLRNPLTQNHLDAFMVLFTILDILIKLNIEIIILDGIS